VKRVDGEMACTQESRVVPGSDVCFRGGGDSPLPQQPARPGLSAFTEEAEPGEAPANLWHDGVGRYRACPLPRDSAQRPSERGAQPHWQELCPVASIPPPPGYKFPAPPHPGAITAINTGLSQLMPH